MKLGKQKKVSRQWFAWLMVFAMTLTMVNIPVQFTKASEGITVSVPSKTEVDAIYNVHNTTKTEYIGDVEFDIPTQIATKDAISKNGVTSVDVTLTVTGFTSASGETAAAMLFFQPGEDGKWLWNATDGVELAQGKQITLNFSFSAMEWNGGSTLGKWGVRFSNLAEGSKVNFKIDSAKLNTSTTTSPGGGNSSEDASKEKITITQTTGTGNNPPDYAEYCFTITNNGDTAVSGIQILIPTSKAITGKVSAYNSLSASYVADEGGIVVYYSATIDPGQTVGTEHDKVGFPIDSSITVGKAYVLAVNAGNPNGGSGSSTGTAGLNYPLTGQKDLDKSETPVGIHGKLSVQEVEGYSAPVLVDKNNNPIQLRGASTHGMQWGGGRDFENFVTKGAFHTLRDEWGINLIRLASYVHDYNGYTQGGQQILDTLIQQGVEYATDLGMYVIIDWHVLDFDPNDEITEAKKFFKKYAEKYANYDNVLYEICNEPLEMPWYNNGNGGDLFTYCDEIIKVIRQYDDDGIIICGTSYYSQHVDAVAAHSMKDYGTYKNNIMYTLHFYSGSHYGELMDKLRTATNAGTPVFVTEFGICHASGNTPYDTANADLWMELLDELNISFACWSLCNKNEAASYFVPSCTKTEGGWTADDMTTTGIWLFNTCRARQDKELEQDTSIKPGDTPGSGGDTPGSGGQTPGPGGNTPGPGGNTPGPGGNTPGPGGNTPGPGGNTPGPGGNTPGSGGDTPDSGGNTPGPGGNTPAPGEETPIPGAGKPGSSGLYSDNPTEGVNATSMNLAVDVKNVKNLAVKSKYQLAPKKSMQLHVTLLPANAAAQKLTYNSSKPSIATVSATGKVVAGKKAGKTVITITSESGLQKKLTVQVMKKAVKKITIKASKKKIKVKKKVKLKAKMKPGKSKASASLYWKSSNNKVATVTQKGVVKAKKKGKVKITAYATDGSGKKKAVKLTVKK